VEEDIKKLSATSPLMMRMSLLLSVAAILAQSVFAGEFPDSLTWDNSAEIRAEHAALEGKPMPGLELTNWINGEVSPTDMKGKVVLVDFYATWCDVCLAVVPHNNDLLKRYKDKGLVIVGVCGSQMGQEKMEQIVQEKGIEYPTARDAQLHSEKLWHVHYYPTYALVDRKGIVRVIGLRPQYVEGVVRKLLSEPASKE
jgi:thiol-disulfide isomerase/thioredoxin